MQAHDTPVYDLIVEIRAAFNALKAASDAMIEDLGVTAAMRAVLEYLDGNGPHTVPQIAKAKTVSRQHIQVLADALSDRGLVRFADNPGHKRSRLLELTGDGRAVFAQIRRREAEALKGLGATFQSARLRDAVATLRELRARLAAG